MNGQPYEPRPGSVAQRAIAILGQRGEMNAAQLADVLGIGPNNVLNNIETAVKHGAITRRKRAEGATAPWWYRLASDALPAWPAPAPAEAPAPKAGTASARQMVDESAAAICAEPHAAPKPQPAPIPSKAVAKPEATAPQASSAGAMRVALWSDGELHILRGDAEPILLTREETKELVRYLDSISLEGCA